MKKIGVIFTLLILMSIGFASAEDFTFEQGECQTLLQYKNQIVGIELPEDIPITSEIINIYLSESSYGYIQIEEKKVSDFGCTENEDATYDFLIKDEQTLMDISSSEDQVNELLNKFKSGEIELKGKTFGRKIKSFFVRIGIKWFF